MERKIFSGICARWSTLFASAAESGSISAELAVEVDGQLTSLLCKTVAAVCLKVERDTPQTQYSAKSDEPLRREVYSSCKPFQPHHAEKPAPIRAQADASQAPKKRTQGATHAILNLLSDGSKRSMLEIVSTRAITHPQLKANSIRRSLCADSSFFQNYLIGTGSRNHRTYQRADTLLENQPVLPPSVPDIVTKYGKDYIAVYSFFLSRRGREFAAADAVQIMKRSPKFSAMIDDWDSPGTTKRLCEAIWDLGLRKQQLHCKDILSGQLTQAGKSYKKENLRYWLAAA